MPPRAGPAHRLNQWLKNGTAYPGATNPNLTLTNVSPALTPPHIRSPATNSQAGLLSSNAVIRVLVPERLAAFPSCLPGKMLQESDLLRCLPTAENLIYLQRPADLHRPGQQLNLSTWATLTNALSITNGMVLLTDTFTNSPMKYYRISEH